MPARPPLPRPPRIRIRKGDRLLTRGRGGGMGSALRGALENAVDQVFFSLKRAHHATLGFMRKQLKEFGLTPARVDFLQAIKLESTQLGVQRRLGLAPSTVCAMLEELGLIWRERFKRTKFIFLRQKAMEMLQRAYDVIVNPGNLPVLLDG